MKQLFGFALGALLVLSSCTKTTERSGNQYKLTGTLRGIPDGTIVLIYQQGREQVVIDSIEVKGGNFTSMKAVPDSPISYLLINEEKRQFIPIVLDSTNISLNGNIDSLSQVLITGSKEQEVFDTNAKISGDYNSGQITKLQYQDKFIALAQKYPSSKIVLNSLLSGGIYSLDAGSLTAVCKYLTPTFKNDPNFKKVVDFAIKSSKVAAGNAAPDFSIPTADGKLISLSKFKGKYLVIDFWASWCGPCRRANPTMVELYKNYSPTKKFDILGISLDSKKEDWLKAIKDDKLTWTHVSNLKSWNDPVAKDYAVNSIPHTLLIDPNGKILGHFSPEELKTILKGIFQK